MDFQTTDRPDFSTSTPEEVAQWVEAQFELLTEVLAEGVTELNLLPRVSLPSRYGEGTICNFVIQVSLSDGTILNPGLYIFRQGSGTWNKLEEIV